MSAGIGYTTIYLELEEGDGSPPTRHSRLAEKRPSKSANAFMLFRKHVIRNNLIPKEMMGHQNSVSVAAAALWKVQNPEVRTMFFRLAEEVKMENFTDDKTDKTNAAGWENRDKQGNEIQIGGLEPTGRNQAQRPFTLFPTTPRSPMFDQPSPPDSFRSMSPSPDSTMSVYINKSNVPVIAIPPACDMSPGTSTNSRRITPSLTKPQVVRGSLGMPEKVVHGDLIEPELDLSYEWHASANTSSLGISPFGTWPETDYIISDNPNNSPSFMDAIASDMKSLNIGSSSSEVFNQNIKI